MSDGFIGEDGDAGGVVDREIVESGAAHGLARRAVHGDLAAVVGERSIVEPVAAQVNVASR